MSNYTIRGKQIRQETKKSTGETRQILETELVEESPPCKECKKELRRHGSSRCEKCSILNQTRIFNAKKLSRRIAEANITK